MAKSETPASAVLAVRTSTDIEALGDLERILLTGKGPDSWPEETPEDASRAIIAQILSAETDDEIESIGQAEGWQELEGVPVQIQGFRWRKSDYEQGPPVYCVVFGNRMDDGSAVVLTTGSGNVMAQLCTLAKRSKLPGAIRYLKRADRPTQGGFYPLMLFRTDAEKAEANAERAAAS